MRKSLILLFCALLTPLARADVTLAAGGDVMIGNTTYDAVVETSTFGPSATRLLKTADIAIVNLEGPIGGNREQKKGCSSERCFAFRQPEKTAELLSETGIDLVSVANNHALDFGPSGQESTATALMQNNIGHAGYLGRPAAQLSRRGIRIGFLSFSANIGVRDLRQTEEMQATIAVAKETSDLLIVSFHMGAEGPDQAIPVIDRNEVFYGENRGNPYRIARFAIDAGADVILGSGPHVPRGLDVYKGRLIAYSLGNFLTAKGIRITGILGFSPLLSATISNSGELKSFRVDSFLQDGMTLVPDAATHAAILMRSLSSEAAQLFWQP